MICCLFVGSISLHAQFEGGEGDGAYKSGTIQITLNGQQINSIALYKGGSGDGNDKISIQTTLSGESLAALFEGGNGDGNSKLFISASLDGQDLAQLYNGGIGDGSHKISIETTLDGATLSQLFEGGNGDGQDKDDFSGVLDGTTLDGLYSGGFGDGHSKINVELVLDGTTLDQLYGGGIGDGHDKDDFSGIVDGTSLAGLYSGGIGDGFSKNDIQYIFDFPDCTFVVNTDDDGFGSLRYAINCAVDGDTIEFSQLLSNDSIVLTTGPLTVFQNLLYIDADPSKNLTVDGSLEPNTLFTGLNGPADLKIKGLNIKSGGDPFGGAIINGGLLTLEDLNIIDTYGGAATVIATFNGGALIIKGTVQILEN